MLSPGTHVIFNFLAIFYFVRSNALLKDDTVKDFGRDFHTCMDDFVVNADFIIRTQDSRKLGAKFLNDMDVESRHDCKRFCCETDMCDVFIFEEKKPGSCYLFHCGPPHDFKCKFTNHSSYTSGILTIVNPQQTSQIEEQIRRVKQEHELKSLRKISNSASLEYPITEPPPVVITQIPKLQLTTTLVTDKTVCSRNQYECKSTRECIAIYNVCDGIPQCADGSDESSDLGCPTEKSTVAPQPLLPEPILPVVPPEVPNYQQMVPHHKSYAPMFVMPQDDVKPWQSQNPAHQIMPQQQSIQYPIDQVMLSQPQMNVAYPRYQWNYPFYGPNNLNLPHEQNKMPYEQEESRGFHRKRPGVTNENEESNLQNTYNKPFVPYYMPANRESWPDDQRLRMEPPMEPQVDSKIGPQSERRDEIRPQVPQEIPVKQQPELRTTTKPELKPPETKPQPPPQPRLEPKPLQNIEPHPTVAPQIVQTQIIETKVQPEQSSTPAKIRTKDKIVENHTVKPKITETVQLIKKENAQPTEKKAEVQRVLSQHKKEEEEKVASVAEHFRLENNEEEKMRPKGAVISLALGLTVTAIMAVLIACRLRVVRRRGRRRHEPYAHDADYLVNGMYL